MPLPLPPFPPFFALAPPFFVIIPTSLRTLKALCLRLIMTEKRSKSESDALLALIANFFAAEVSSHFFFRSNSSQSFLTHRLDKNRCYLLDVSSTGASQHLHSKLGQRESLDGVSHAGEASGWAIYEHSVLVNEVHDHTHFAIIFSVVNKRNSSRLYKSPQCLRYQ